MGGLTSSPPAYAELHARSAFSLLDAATMPAELARRAEAVGLTTLALTDRDELGGAIRFAEACAEHGVRPIFGAELSVDCLGARGALVLLCEDRRGWANLATLITRARMDRPRGAPRVGLETLAGHAAGLVCLDGGLGGPLEAPLSRGLDSAQPIAGALAEIFEGRFYLEVTDFGLTEDVRRGRDRLALARRLRLPWLVTGDVRHATRAEKLVWDALVCVREGTTLEDAGDALFPNDARRLRSPREVQAAFRDHHHGLWRTLEVAERCRFHVRDLRPSLPRFPVPSEIGEGGDPDAYLAQRVAEGARARYGTRLTARHEAQISHELEVIRRMDLAGYFLIVWDITRFAARSGVLAQGRGSAANSAVCYCLGITAVDPVGGGLLFERFLSEGRDQAPDIDVDLAHQDRERVLAYVYERYGREHAAMVCTSVTWRAKSAVRDAARVLGLPAEVAGRLAREVGRAASSEVEESARTAAERLAAGGLKRAGLDDRTPTARALVRLVAGLEGLPRHRSIHVGGFVLTGERLSSVVPVEPASMDGRTVIQWDKDDLPSVGLVKIDLLGLGMLTLLAEAGRMLEEHRGEVFDLARLPPDDPKTFAMIRAADTVGVFQIESRAQMNTLPRTRPSRFYDLVVQVALVRPGPIQGEMVHPYLRRRRGEEPVTYLHPSLEPVLERTLGVPLFQEQGMRVAVTAAGFTPAQADELRRAMSNQRSAARMARSSLALADGMTRRGIDAEVQARIVKQLTSFASYGFPESHAASFALLVYASAWLKAHRAPEFYASLLNAQPMGFYPVGTLVADARRRGVEVRGPDVLASEWACSLEPIDGGAHPLAVRVGLSLVHGLGDAKRDALVRAREEAARLWWECGGADDRGPERGDTYGCNTPRPGRANPSRANPGGANPGEANPGEANPGGSNPGGAHAHARAGASGGRRRPAGAALGDRAPALHVLAAYIEASELPVAALRSLARSGALDRLAGDRRRALWEVMRLARPRAGPLDRAPRGDDAPHLPPLTQAERMIDDYASYGATTGPHPMELLRARHASLRDLPRTAELAARSAGPVRVAGLVNSRQSPMTAKGFVFVSLEDETGMVNVVVSPDLARRQRRVLLDHPILLVEGELQRHQGATNVKAHRLRPVATTG